MCDVRNSVCTIRLSVRTYEPFRHAHEVIMLLAVRHLATATTPTELGRYPQSSGAMVC